ncbi:MAG: AMP-binding protein, partial [Algicola sp.]|nr:AMP-binding protein [Algicola sp.]
MNNNNTLINPQRVSSVCLDEAYSLNLDSQKVPFEHMVAIIQWHLARHPAREVLSFLTEGETPSGSLSFASLDDKAREIAVQLAADGQQGDRALLVFHNGIDFITAFFGCLYAGVCAVPVYPPQNRHAYLERLEMIATDCGARYMLGNSDYFAKVDEHLQGFDTLGATAKIAVDNLSVNPDDYMQPALERGSLAFLQYTSGSTSAPKGVMVSHGNLINNIVSMQNCFDHDERTVIVSWLPMFHDMGLIGAVLQPICIGAKVIAMAPAAFLQKPMRWLDAVAKYRGTTTYAPNFAYELCVAKVQAADIERLDLTSWSMALNGAEPIKPETLEAFKNTFAPCG